MNVKTGRLGRVNKDSDCQGGGWWFKSWHRTTAETLTWGRQLASMLALYTGKDVRLEVNFREYISHTPLPSVSKVAHSGFEIQRRHHQKSRTGVSVAPKMDITYKKSYTNEGKKTSQN